MENLTPRPDYDTTDPVSPVIWSWAEGEARRGLSSIREVPNFWMIMQLPENEELKRSVQLWLMEEKTRQDSLSVGGDVTLPESQERDEEEVDDARSVDSRGKHSAISEVSGTKAGGEEVQEGELGSSATEPGPGAQEQEGNDGAASSEKEKVHDSQESVVESPNSKNLSKTSTIDSLGGNEKPVVLEEGEVSGSGSGEGDSTDVISDRVDSAKRIAEGVRVGRSRANHLVTKWLRPSNFCLEKLTEEQLKAVGLKITNFFTSINSGVRRRGLRFVASTQKGVERHSFDIALCRAYEQFAREGVPSKDWAEDRLEYTMCEAMLESVESAPSDRVQPFPLLGKWLIEVGDGKSSPAKRQVKRPMTTLPEAFGRSCRLLPPASSSSGRPGPNSGSSKDSAGPSTEWPDFDQGRGKEERIVRETGPTLSRESDLEKGGAEGVKRPCLRENSAVRRIEVRRDNPSPSIPNLLGRTAIEHVHAITHINREMSGEAEVVAEAKRQSEEETARERYPGLAVGVRSSWVPMR